MKYAWVLAVALAVSPLAVAQRSLGENGTGFAVQVPFEFMVGNKIVPAGEYTFQSANTWSQTLLIRKKSGNINMFSPSAIGENSKTAGSDGLLFHKYGDRYFLWAVEVKGSRTVYEVPETKAEAELRAQNLPETVEATLVARK
jgi:hypothetical protein